MGRIAEMEKVFSRFKQVGLISVFIFGSAAWGDVDRIAVEPGTGHVYVAGNFSGLSTQVKSGLIRLFTNGSVDLSFDVGAGFQKKISGILAFGKIQHLLPLPSGKILVAGDFDHFQGEPVANLVRLDQNGKLDEDYEIGTGFFSDHIYSGKRYYERGRIRSLALQSDGKVLVVGEFNRVSGISVQNLARLNADGTLDYSFKAHPKNPAPTEDLTGLIGNVHGIVQAADGTIWVSGKLFSYLGQIRLPHLIPDAGLLKLGRDGEFQGFFQATEDPLTWVGLSYRSGQPDARVFATDGKFVYRFQQDGQKDQSFISLEAKNLAYAPPLISSVEPLPAGGVLVGGNFVTYGKGTFAGLVQLDSSGNLDPRFNQNHQGKGFTGGFVTDVRLGLEGTILVGGSFRNFQGQFQPLLLRLWPKGNLARPMADWADLVQPIQDALPAFEGSYAGTGGALEAVSTGTRYEVLSSSASVERVSTQEFKVNAEVLYSSLSGPTKITFDGKDVLRIADNQFDVVTRCLDQTFVVGQLITSALPYVLTVFDKCVVVERNGVWVAQQVPVNVNIRLSLRTGNQLGLELNQIIAPKLSTTQPLTLNRK